MSDWITDRKPTEEDGILVYSYEGKPWHYTHIDIGQAWKPIPKIEPYVKPRRWFVVWSDFRQCWTVRDHKTKATICLRDDSMNFGLINRYDKKDREAAEEIAAIYERTMP